MLQIKFFGTVKAVLFDKYFLTFLKIAISSSHRMEQ
jgi:hypothetical protein